MYQGVDAVSAAKIAAKNSPERLQLKIVLDHLTPAIWRRVLVNEDISFLQLHKVIQATMGWEDYHMHEFELASPRMSIGTKSSDDFFPDDRPMLPERTTRLADVLGAKKKFRYWYDFGDDWWHTISIEKCLPPNPAAPAAELLAGEFACPLEDCGGPYGYADMLDVTADPRHPEHAEIAEWLVDFDPEEFDLTAHARKVAGAIKRKRKPAAG